MGRDRKRFNLKTAPPPGKLGKRHKKDKHKGPDEGGSGGGVAVEGVAFAGKYDEANPLLLPGTKKKKDKVDGGVLVSRGGGGPLLSRKQRKKLEGVVSRREKKKGRAGLLAELGTFALPPATLAALTPLVTLQSQPHRHKLLNQLTLLGATQPTPKEKEGRGQRSSLKGAKKKASTNRLPSWSRRFAHKGKISDPKVLGFEDEDEDSSHSEPESEQGHEQEGEDEELKQEVEQMEESEESEVEPEENVVEESVEDVAMEEIKPEETAQKEETTKSSEKVEPIPRKKKRFVPVFRTDAISALRSKLPILPEEQVIMEAIYSSKVTLLAGETGSGKTTQLPQFLYEAGYSQDGKIIGVTEPRRVAATAMSKRVGLELNLPENVVSYQIRFEGNTGPSTQIKFMTDGVLLKEMERDFLLRKYSVICIDEAHERSLYTDLLLGLLSRSVLLRAKGNHPLKLVVMSATLRVSDFLENSTLFKEKPSLVHVPSRQFPVSIHWAKVTPENYVVASIKKAKQIHKKLPKGGILIFLTGAQEVKTVVKKLKELFPAPKHQEDNEECKEGISSSTTRSKSKRKTKTPTLNVEADKRNKDKSGKKSKDSKKPLVSLRSFDLDKLGSLPLPQEEEEDDLSSEEEDTGPMGGCGFDSDDDEASIREPLHVLPLYSMLPSAEQQKVFEAPPPGSRLCVVATNVAETSLTIPSIRYVIDSGKVKTKLWDKLTGVETFAISWESQASAEQRAGRAGRTGPGHVYRLFSSSLFSSEFPAYSPPELQVRPIEDMILLMKSMGIDRVQNFPYPSPPSKDQLVAGEKTLLALGALELKDKGIKDDTSVITGLGRTMAAFPVGPRFAKMLALSFHHSLAEYMILLVSALTVQEVFLDAQRSFEAEDCPKKEQKGGWKALRKKWAGVGPTSLLGDPLLLLRAVGAFEYSGGSPDFCLKTGLRYKALVEIRKLRRQLTSDLNLLVSSNSNSNEDSSEGRSEVGLNPRLDPPTEAETLLLRQLFLSGLPDRVGRRISEEEIRAGGHDPKEYRKAYRCGELESPVFLHPSCSLSLALPPWIVYQQILESSSGKLLAVGVTAIEPEWIPTFCGSLCNYGSPLEQPPPYYNEEKGTVYASFKGTYGKQGWELPLHCMEMPRSLLKFQLFATFFLEGRVFPRLSTYFTGGHLLSSPQTMSKPWAKLQPRTTLFLNALTTANVCDKGALLAKWEDDPTFLLKEYSAWLPDSLRTQVASEWPLLTNL